LLKVQNIVMPTRHATEPMYLRSTRPLDYDRETGVRIAHEQTVDFDSYFNSFFESHFAPLSSARSVWLCLRVSGELALEIVRGSRHAGELLVRRARIGRAGEETRHEIELPLEETAPTQGRLAFKLTALSEGCALHEGAWCLADTEKRREVKLDLVLTTHGHEAQLKRTVADVLACRELAPQLGRILVVDRGATLAAEDFTDPRVRLISLSHPVGASAFAAGLVAALEEPGTHVAAIDDDVELDVEVLLRLTRALSVMTGEHAIAGDLLDGSRPTFLWKAVSRRNADQPFSITIQHIKDLSSEDGLLWLTDVRHEHGGWWLFAAPKQAVRQAGLPVPALMHVDDIEYAARLRLTGVNSFPMPGIGVWRSPYWAKLEPWIAYYDYRNQLIRDALEGEFSVSHVARRFTVDVGKLLLRYDYQQAALVMQALEDFAAGPDVALAQPREKHAELVALAKAYAPRRSDLRLVTTPEMHGLPISLGRPAKLLRLLTLNGHLVPRKPRPRDGFRYAVFPYHFRWDSVDGPSVAVKDPFQGGFSIYDRDPARFWSLGQRAARLAARLAVEYPQMRERWQTRLAELTSPAAWNRFLGLDPVVDAGPTPSSLSSARTRS
jgi:galactofuranosylgalactofuranosylrhamnosyl-N-acetylglucosaminyl-diphospho-decaprenol beta-1,5/1,6-galactofuranosyltransferase